MRGLAAAFVVYCVIGVALSLATTEVALGRHGKPGKPTAHPLARVAVGLGWPLIVFMLFIFWTLGRFKIRTEDEDDSQKVTFHTDDKDDHQK